MDPNDFLALLSGSDTDAQAMAKAMAQGSARNQALGQLASIIGGPLKGAGARFAEDAQSQNQLLERAAQARTAQATQRMHLQDQADWRNAMIGLRSGEMTTTHDAIGNPIQLAKYPGMPPQVPGLTPGAAAPAAGGTRLGGGAVSMNPNDIVQSVIEGRTPPDLKGMSGKMKSAVTAGLASRGFNQSDAVVDWTATQKHLATLNGPQQTRLRQVLDSIPHQLDNVQSLYDQWQKLGTTTGLKIFNRASLTASKNLGGEVGAIATNLEAQIKDIASEVGNVYQGGNSPTDHALHMAETNLSADWDEPTFRMAMDLLRKNVGIRKASVMASPVAGLQGPSRYSPDAKPVATPEDDAAKKWLESNPTHPKADAVRAKLKAKGL